MHAIKTHARDMHTHMHPHRYTRTHLFTQTHTYTRAGQTHMLMYLGNGCHGNNINMTMAINLWVKRIHQRKHEHKTLAYVQA